MGFKVVPIPDEIAAKVRETLVSPQYNSLKANVSVANGYGPCRSCLQTFDEGREERIDFTYNSFDGLSSLPDPGPVFIHKEKCESYSAAGFPAMLQELPLLFEGYGRQSELITRQPVDKGSPAQQIEQILEQSQVNFVNIRNSEAGCFVARIERVD